VQILAGRDSCRAFFKSGWWRDMAVLRQLIGEDGRIVADITPEETQRISQLLSCHPQADPPPTAGEVFELEHQLFFALYPDAQRY
jgi:hypothetical protein